MPNLDQLIKHADIALYEANTQAVIGLFISISMNFGAAKLFKQQVNRNGVITRSNPLHS